MKKRKTAFLIVFCVAILVGVIVIGIQIVERKNLKHFFDSWEPEVTDQIHTLTYARLDPETQNVDLFSFFEKSHGVLGEVFCVQNGRVYFSYRKNAPADAEGKTCTYFIASCDLSASDFQVHYSADFQISNKPLPNGILSDYYRLNCLSDYNGIQGGAYSSGQILLQDQNQTVIYDVASDQATVYQTDSEIQNATSAFFHRELTWEIHDHSEIVFSNAGIGEKRELTLEKMADSSHYAKKLLDISEKKIWDKNMTYGGQFFTNVKILDGTPYLICQILRWNGNSVAIVFQYDFQTNSVRFVRVESVGGNVDSNFDILK